MRCEQQVALTLSKHEKDVDLATTISAHPVGTETISQPRRKDCASDRSRDHGRKTDHPKVSMLRRKITLPLLSRWLLGGPWGPG